MKSSAVTIIVVTIFIAIFQNYRIVFLSRYFLCVRNDIFSRHLRYASTIDSLPVYSSFSTLQSRAANDVTRAIAARRPWLSSVSVRERRCNCLWSTVSQVVSVRRAVCMTSQLTTRTVLTRRVSSYGLPAALSVYGVNAAGIAEIVDVIFRNDSSLAEMPGSFA